MGRENVLAVYALWPELDHGPFRLLAGMAAVSLDPPGGRKGRKPCLFYNGEDGLMMLTGRGRTETYRMLKTLLVRGAIVVEGTGHLGSKAVYRVVIDAASIASKTPHPKSQRVRNTRTRKGPQHPNTSGSATPEHLGGVKEDGKENRVASPKVVQTARATPATAKAMTHEEANQILTQRLGVVAAIELAESHDPACACDDIQVCLARSLVGRTRLHVIDGGKS